MRSKKTLSEELDKLRLAWTNLLTTLKNLSRNDVIVRMPPVKQYVVEVKIKSVEKAVPRIVEPEGL